MKTFSALFWSGMIASINASTLIENNKCCPGPAVGNGSSPGSACCVLAGGIGNQVLDLTNLNCVAKVSVDDSDYDNKVKQALASATGSATGTATPNASTAPTSSASVVSTSSDTGSGSTAAATATSTSTSSSQSTGAGGKVGMDHVLIAGLVGLAAGFSAM